MTKIKWVLLFVGGIGAGWLVGSLASAATMPSDLENTVKAHAAKQREACKAYETKVMALVKDSDSSVTKQIVEEKDVPAALDLLKATPRISAEDDQLRTQAMDAYNNSKDPKKTEIAMPFDRCVMGYNKLSQGLIGALNKKNNPQTSEELYSTVKSFIEDKKQKEVISLMVDLALVREMTRAKLVKIKTEQEKNLDKLSDEARAWSKELMVKAGAATDQVKAAIKREEKETPVWRDKLVRAFNELKK